MYKKIRRRLKFLFFKTYNIIGSRDHLSLVPQDKEILVHEAELTHPAPANIEQIREVWKPEPHWLTYKTNNVYLNYFPDVLVSVEGIIFKGTNAYAGSYVYPAFYEKFGVNYLLQNYKGRNMVRLDPSHEYLLVHDHWSASNYFHWICDAIPKLALFKKRYPGKKVKVLLPSTVPRYITDSVALYGFAIEYILPDQYILAEKLWHVDYLAASGFASPYLYETVETLVSRRGQNKHRKIYISRALSSKRSLENESELIDLLKNKGYEICYTEKMSLEEQIKTFSEADTLMSCHGAGLTNMIFMPEDSKIIEIGYEDIRKQPVCYWALANILRDTYYYVPTPSTGADSFVLNDRSLLMIREILG